MISSRPIPGHLWIVQLSEHLNVRVALYIQKWPAFDKRTIGDQLIRATDSIGLNISEGYARVHLKERLQFFSIARGSLEEALFAIRRARDRGLLSRLDAGTLSGLLMNLGKALNTFEQTIRSKAEDKANDG
jgi:four helix bundle protein